MHKRIRYDPDGIFSVRIPINGLSLCDLFNLAFKESNEMKKPKRVLVGVMLFAFLLGFFAVNNAFAAWMTEATILNVSVSEDGDYTIRAQSGTWAKTFLVDTTLSNAKAILAVALTAASSGKTVTIEHTGDYIIKIFLLSA